MEADRTSLEIREVFPEDAGTYVVIAKNLGGESRTSCLLTLEGAAINGEVPLTGAEASSRPIFIQPLQNKEVQEGSRAHLMCVVSGQPKPEVGPVEGLITCHRRHHSCNSTTIYSEHGCIATSSRCRLKCSEDV